MSGSNKKSDGDASSMIAMARHSHEARAQQVVEQVVATTTTTTTSGGATTQLELPKKIDVLLGRDRGPRTNSVYQCEYQLWEKLNVIVDLLDHLLCNGGPTTKHLPSNNAVLVLLCPSGIIKHFLSTYLNPAKQKKVKISNSIVDQIVKQFRFLKQTGPDTWTAISNIDARKKVAQSFQYHKRRRALRATGAINEEGLDNSSRGVDKPDDSDPAPGVAIAEEETETILQPTVNDDIDNSPVDLDSLEDLPSFIETSDLSGYPSGTFSLHPTTGVMNEEVSDNNSRSGDKAEELDPAAVVAVAEEKTETILQTTLNDDIDSFSVDLDFAEDWLIETSDLIWESEGSFSLHP